MALSVGRPTRLALATLALLALALLALVTSPGLPAALLGARAGRGLAERGGGRGAALTEKLENVFSAPLDAITGFFTKAVHASQGQGTGGVQLNHVAKLSGSEVELRPSSVAPGTRLAVSTAQ
ncbi:hypothetical protein T484DRAFT_1845683, partial [Baffinella frigidus]